MKKILFLLLALHLLPVTLHAESALRAEFFRSFLQGDMEQSLEVLERWAESEPEDPELYVCYSNFHLKRARTGQESSISEEASPSMLHFLLKPQQEAAPTGATMPSLDPAEFNLALEYLDRALDMQPTRLDIYFTKTDLLLQVGRYDEVNSCLLRLLDATQAHDSPWFEDYQTQVRQPLEKALTPKVQNVLYKLTSSQVPQATDIVLSVSRKMVEAFPDSTFGYTNLAEYYKAQQDHDNALLMYQQAEAVDPANSTILTNIIELYIKLGDATQAITYLEKLRETGSQRDKEYVEEKLMELTR